MKSMTDWLRRGEYLPKFLRDFHDQKDVFKTIHARIDPANDSIKDVSWVKGHCYVIDIFLWFMARRGWTLQRCKKDLPFEDIEKDIERQKEIESEMFEKHMKELSKDGAS